MVPKEIRTLMIKNKNIRKEEGAPFSTCRNTVMKYDVADDLMKNEAVFC